MKKKGEKAAQNHISTVCAKKKKKRSSRGIHEQAPKKNTRE